MNSFKHRMVACTLTWKASYFPTLKETNTKADVKTCAEVENETSLRLIRESGPSIHDSVNDAMLEFQYEL